MSTVAKKVIMGSGAVDAYEIDQSLIFDDGGVASMVRTPSSTGNRKTWTLSVWLKRVDFATGSPNGYQMIYGGQSAYETTIRFVDNKLEVNSWTGTAFEFNWVTTREFRDPSAWFHLVVAFDSTQGTDTNRIKVYIDGEQQTPTTVAYPDQNLDTRMNLASLTQYIGRYHNPAYSYNGYMAEFNWLDGTAAAASSFGETNEDTGQWIPKKYSGSYGTNGFYLKFVSGALGTDSSGQGNNYTASNLANADVVKDSPTNNFATWDSNIPTPYYVFAEGNLKVTVPNQWRNAIATMGVSTGKWYWEQIVSASSLQYCNTGFVTDKGLFDNWLGSGTYLGYKSWSWGYDGSNGKLWHNAAAGTQLTGAPTTEWKAGVALDLDSGKAWFSLNGTWMGTSANPSTGAGPAFTSLPSGSTYYPATTVYNLTSTANFGQNGTFSGLATAQGNTDTNGIGDFFYPVPTSFKALCTANLPDPAIPLPEEHFNTVLYTGNDADDRTITTGMQSDFVWIKTRNAANNHNLFDKVRGVGKALYSNATDAESTRDDSLTAFLSTGFTIDQNAAYNDLNGSDHTYVSWNWKANGSGSTDTSGDIDAVVSANQASGFSIVTWTGNGSNAGTVPHGLGVAPEMVIYKRRNNGASNWVNWVTVIDGGDDYLSLNTTGAAASLSGVGSITSSFISNAAYGSEPMLAYCFASKPSFSKIGVYTGNGSATAGPFVNLGFKPAWIMIKRTDAVKGWYIRDTAREPSNVMDTALLAQVPDAEVSSANYNIDYLSNGFKPRSTHASSNANGGTYLYMAFAEAPFKTANAR